MAAASKHAPRKPRTTRAEAKQQTRALFVKAAAEMLFEQGPAALSTLRLAKRIGKGQATFYVHFSDLDELLEEAARSLAEDYRRMLEESRKGLAERGPLSLDGTVIRHVLENPRWPTLAFRHRRDPNSIVGRVAAEFFEATRQDLQRDLHALGLHQGIADFDLFVELVLSMGIGVLEGVVDGRFRDVQTALNALIDGVMGTHEAMRRRQASR